MGAGCAQAIEQVRQISRVGQIRAHEVRSGTSHAVTLANRLIGIDRL